MFGSNGYRKQLRGMKVQMRLGPNAAVRAGDRSAGFTLVELTIVILILAILAALVIPQFSSASDESRDNSLKMNLYRIRQQLEVYRQQHNGNWPSQANFVEQMTMASNADGQTAEPGTAGYPYGPYIREIPVNPWTNTATTGSGDIGTSDWYYNESTGEFRPNNSEDAAGL